VITPQATSAALRVAQALPPVTGRRLKPETARSLTASLARLAEATRADNVVMDMRRYWLTREHTFAARLDGQFRQLGEHVARAADEVGGILVEEDVQANANETMRIQAIITASNLREWAGKHIRPEFEKEWKGAAEAVVAALSRHGLPATMRENIMQEILRTAGKRAGLVDIIGDTKSALFRVLDVAREEGLGPRAAAKWIREFVPAGRFVNAGSAYRSTMIARTELLHAQRKSSLEMYHSMPQVNMVIAYDGESDEFCASRNGALFTLEDAEFEMNSDETHPNCVLAFAPASV
jgi:hypothetical protein